MPNSSSVLEEVDEKAGLAFRNVFQSDYWIPDLKAGKPEWIADNGFPRHAYGIGYFGKFNTDHDPLY